MLRSVVVVVVGFFQLLSGVAVRVRLGGTHQVDILLGDEAQRRELRRVAQRGGGGGGRVGGDRGSLSVGGGRGGGAGLQAVVLHLG